MILDREGIKQLIPHREPFLFIDEILELSEEQIVARREIRGDEPQFEGHYPGNPIMPGVLLCEATFQAAAVLLAKRLELAADGATRATPILARVSDARFKQMVKPGDVVEIVVDYKNTVSQFHFLKGSVRKGGKAAATLEFALALVYED